MNKQLLVVVILLAVACNQQDRPAAPSVPPISVANLPDCTCDRPNADAECRDGVTRVRTTFRQFFLENDHDGGWCAPDDVVIGIESLSPIQVDMNPRGSGVFGTLSVSWHPSAAVGTCHWTVTSATPFVTTNGSARGGCSIPIEFTPSPGDRAAVEVVDASGKRHYESTVLN